ncbi:hypothetical protein QYF36_001784 [Acer negundo]|nr:hypothetical protein QYF36_001784 [Acer negundo]
MILKVSSWLPAPKNSMPNFQWTLLKQWQYSKSLKLAKNSGLLPAIPLKWMLFDFETVHIDRGNNILLSLFLVTACLQLLRRMGRQIPRHKMKGESQNCLK